MSAYFVATAAAVGMTRFEGGAASVWIASAVLLAALITSSTRDWPATIIGCLLTGIVTTSIWGVGWYVAPFLSAITVGECLIAALLIRRWRISRSTLDSLPSLARFVLAAGFVAPALTALPGAAFISYASATGFTMNFVRWFNAHALGMLTFTPIFVLIASGEFGGWFRSFRLVQVVEACGLIGLVALVALAVFSQVTLPLLFLPVLPLMVVTFRLGKFGAASGLVLLALIGGWLTLQGSGPIALLHGSGATHIQFFQFYLSVTVMTVLPVAADLTRREQLFQRLRDSEARYRLLTEKSTDIVMNLHVDGTIRYVSPSIVRLGGYEPETLIGRASVDLIAVEDRDQVRAVHRRALQSPGETFSVEFRGLLTAGETRWFETHTQAVIDDAGVVSGVVSAIREISQRKRVEVELALAAETDALTGLANRRAFDRKMEALLSGEGPVGCVAVFDLDHFKRVNDNFGHATGDVVLKAFARVAAAHVREGDVLARIGGEEFGLIFANIPLATANLVCERIRLAIAAIVVPVGEWPLRITVSVGVAPANGVQTAADVLGNADRALYEAKALGRNRSALAA